MDTAHIVVLITAKNVAEAQKISEGLLEAKLVACVNIIKGIESLFWWEGKLDHANEILLIAKTKASVFKAVKATVKKLHSYKVPEVIALPIVDGNPDYLNWISESVK